MKGYSPDTASNPKVRTGPWLSGLPTCLHPVDVSGQKVYIYTGHYQPGHLFTRLELTEK